MVQHNTIIVKNVNVFADFLKFQYYFSALLVENWHKSLKGAVAWDFFVGVFFMNQLLLGSWLTVVINFPFFGEFAEIMYKIRNLKKLWGHLKTLFLLSAFIMRKVKQNWPISLNSPKKWKIVLLQLVRILRPIDSWKKPDKKISCNYPFEHSTVPISSLNQPLTIIPSGH
jgi:hypothetical protein